MNGWFVQIIINQANRSLSNFYLTKKGKFINFKNHGCKKESRLRVDLDSLKRHKLSEQVRSDLKPSTLSFFFNSVCVFVDSCLFANKLLPLFDLKTPLNPLPDCFLALI